VHVLQRTLHGKEQRVSSSRPSESERSLLQWDRQHRRTVELPGIIGRHGGCVRTQRELVPAVSTPYRFEVSYLYDSASGALTTVENTQTGFIYWQADTATGTAPVDPWGHLLAYTAGNNVSTVLTFDQATGAPTGLSAGIGQSSAVQQLAYSWDGFGNLNQRYDANQNLTENLTYDDLNRLSTSTVTNSAATGPTLGFTYDAVGDILTKTAAGATETYNYGDPAHPYAVTSVTNGTSSIYSASYDTNGDMAVRNGYNLSWTVDNLPNVIQSSNGTSGFSYGPEHERYLQTETYNGASTNTVYVGGLFEVITSNGGSTIDYRHNIIADGRVVAVHSIDQNGNAHTSYLDYDHLGSVDTITDDNGNVAERMSFDAFGQRRVSPV
jgi:hypothetical protein